MTFCPGIHPMTIRDSRFMMKQLQHWKRNWQSTPVFLPGESHGWRSLAGYSPQGRKESDTTEWLTHKFAAHIRVKELIIYSIFKPIHQQILTLALTPFITPFIVIINYWLHSPYFAIDPYPWGLFILYIAVSTNSSPLYCASPLGITING